MIVTNYYVYLKYEGVTYYSISNYGLTTDIKKAKLYDKVGTVKARITNYLKNNTVWCNTPFIRIPLTPEVRDSIKYCEFNYEIPEQ